MISVTGAQRYLRGDVDRATLAVPERAVGAMVTVNQVLQRLDRLSRTLDERDARDRRTRAPAHAAAAATMRVSRRELFGDEDHERGGGGGGGHGSGLHLGRDLRMARTVLSRVMRSPAARTAGRAGGRMLGSGLVGGRILGAAGSALGAYELYGEARDSGRVDVVNATLTGATAGATIGNIVPVIGTAVGGAIGAAVGAASALAYNNRERIGRAWTRAAHWMDRRTDDAVAVAKNAWTGTTAKFHRMSSIVGDTLHKAWTGATESVMQYGTRVDAWAREQSGNVGTWLDGIVRQIENGINNLSLRQVATEFVDRLRSLVMGLIPGFGGGGGGGGGGGDAPMAPSGFREGSTAPSGRGRAASVVPPAAAPMRPTENLYAPGSTTAGAGRAALSDAPDLGSRASPVDAQGRTIYGSGPSAMGFGTGGVAMPHRLPGAANDPHISDVASAVPTMSMVGGRTTATATIPKFDAGPQGSTREYGGEHAPLQNSPGRSPNTKLVDARLLDIVGAAAMHMPAGYKVTINEGYNAWGHVAGSAHHKAGSGALDLQIWDDRGRPIRNEGDDPTGMYTRLARAAKGEQLKRYPDLTGTFSWGGAHGITTGSNIPDLMHFDVSGERGRITKNLLKNMDVLPVDRPQEETAAVARADAEQNKPRPGFSLFGPARKSEFDAARARDEAADATSPADTTAARKDEERVPFALAHHYRGVVDFDNGGQASYDMRDPDRARAYTRDSQRDRIESNTSPSGKKSYVAITGHHADRVDDVPMRTPDGDLKSSWTPEHAASPKPTTVDESRGRDAPAPAPVMHDDAKSSDGGSSQQTRHNHASIHDIPTVHPNAHLAVSGHTDKYA